MGLVFCFIETIGRRDRSGRDHPNERIFYFLVFIIIIRAHHSPVRNANFRSGLSVYSVYFFPGVFVPILLPFSPYRVVM